MRPFSVVANLAFGATTKFGYPLPLAKAALVPTSQDSRHQSRVLRALSDRILVLRLDAEQQVDLVVHECVAPRDRDVTIAPVALTRLAVVDLRLEAFELRIEHHVDDAGDGVRAVSRRSAARDDLGAPHEHGGDQHEIDGAALRVRHDPFGVDERQRARSEVRVQTPQIRELRADVEVADADVGVGEERGVLWQRAQDVADVHDAEVLDLRRIHYRQRLSRIESAARDARAGNDDFLFLLLGHREPRGGECREQRDTDAENR